jgi:hypothetical protein
MGPVNLGQLVWISSGLSSERSIPPANAETSPFLSVSAKALVDDRLVIPGSDKLLQLERDGTSLLKKSLQPGDVILALRGTSWKVARVTKEHMRAQPAPMIPDSNLAILRPIAEALGGQELASIFGTLLFGWLRTPSTATELMRHRGTSGAFLVRVGDLRELDVPHNLNTLPSEELAKAARMLELAERSYIASLEIAEIRRDLAHRVARGVLGPRDKA